MKKILLPLILAALMMLVIGCAEKPASDSPTTPPPSPSSPAEATPTEEITPDETPEASILPVVPEMPQGNYTDEMKIPYGRDLSPDDGADSVDRMGDHPGSPYFAQLDFYNMESTDTLTILPKFRTIQQSSEWSCGVTAVQMVIEYYGKLGDHDEMSLSELRPQGSRPGATSLDEAIAIFDGVGGFELTTTHDYGEDIYNEFWLTTIQDYLAEGVPVLICWNDWGGHWQAIIGYDTMGTDDYFADDVLIVADPYDTTDHNQDGYGIYGAERFIYNFTMYNFFGDDPADNDMLFIAAKPIA